MRIGNPDIWRAALDGLTGERQGQEHKPSARLLADAERSAFEAALLANMHARHEAPHSASRCIIRETDAIVRQLSGLLPDCPLHP